MTEEKQTCYKDILDTLQRIDTQIALLNALYQVNYTIDSAATVIEKTKNDARKARQRITIAVNQVISEKKALVNNLKNIALSFSDIEEQIFIAKIFEKKTYGAIAKELNLSEGYCKIVGSKLIKRLECLNEKGGKEL